MKTRIQSYFTLPILIATVWMINGPSALAQGGGGGGGGGGAAAGGAAGIQALLNAFGGAAGGAGGGGGGARGGNGAFQSATLVTVVADTVGNNLIVSAPEEILKQIEALVEELDVASDDAVQIRAFFLKNSDPTEMVSLITSLFPDPNQSNTGRGNAGRGAGFAGAGGRGGAAGGTSDRMLRMQKVVAVAEPRTSSVIVSASTQMMGEIARVIDEIDSNPREAQEVAVIKLKGDVSNIQTVLQGLFGRSTTTQNQNNNPLVNRTQFLNGGGASGVTGTGGTAARGAQ